MASFDLPVTITWLEWAKAAAAAEIRRRVFIVEQQIDPHIELDAWDVVARHALAEVGGRAIGTARLIPEGTCAKLGRMAVLPEYRRRGVGAALLEAARTETARLGCSEIVLHAQEHARGFYLRCGYVPEGEPFVEAGIPHVQMRLHL